MSRESSVPIKNVRVKLGGEILLGELSEERARAVIECEGEGLGLDLLFLPDDSSVFPARYNAQKNTATLAFPAYELASILTLFSGAFRLEAQVDPQIPERSQLVGWLQTPSVPTQIRENRAPKPPEDR